MLNHFFHDKVNVYIYNHRESNLKQSVSHAKTCSRFTILCNQTQDVIFFYNLFESIYLKVEESCHLEVQVNCKLLFVFFQFFLLNLYKLLNKIMNLKQRDFNCEI